MRTFDQTVAALGAPASCVALDDWSGQLVVARWRSKDIHVKASAEDAFRIVMSLGLEQTVRYTQTDFERSVASTPGDIRFFPPVASYETTIEGDSDMLHILIAAGARTPLAAGAPTAKPIFNIASEDLRACALSLFMAARSQSGAQPRIAATMLCQTIRQLVTTQAVDRTRIRGGLQPIVLRRIEALIDEQLEVPNYRRPGVADLASVARLSVGQFILAFRQTTGTTPHQYMLARRRQRAMALLRRPKLSIAEVADTLGFSSPAHFVAAFRRRFGTTPGDYRRAILDPN